MGRYYFIATDDVIQMLGKWSQCEKSVLRDQMVDGLHGGKLKSCFFNLFAIQYIVIPSETIWPDIAIPEIHRMIIFIFNFITIIFLVLTFSQIVLHHQVPGGILVVPCFRFKYFILNYILRPKKKSCLVVLWSKNGRSVGFLFFFNLICLPFIWPCGSKRPGAKEAKQVKDNV